MESVSQPSARTGCKRCRRLRVQCVPSRTDPTSPTCSACELSGNLCLQRNSTRSTKTETLTLTVDNTSKSNAAEAITSGGDKAQNEYSSNVKSKLSKVQTVNLSDDSAEEPKTRQGKRGAGSSKADAVVAANEFQETKKKLPRTE